MQRIFEENDSETRHTEEGTVRSTTLLPYNALPC